METKWSEQYLINQYFILSSWRHIDTYLWKLFLFWRFYIPSNKKLPPPIYSPIPFMVFMYILAFFECLARWVKVWADDILKYFFLFFQVNRIWHFMQIVSSGAHWTVSCTQYLAESQKNTDNLYLRRLERSVDFCSFYKEINLCYLLFAFLCTKQFWQFSSLKVCQFPLNLLSELNKFSYFPHKIRLYVSIKLSHLEDITLYCMKK